MNPSLRIQFSGGRSHLDYSVLLQTVLQEFSVTHNQFLVMASLHERADHCASPSELSLDVGRTRSNVTQICNQLVDAGWVQRRHSRENRRRVNVALTSDGARTIREVLQRLRDLIASRVDADGQEARSAPGP